jgi:hypothetical protein
MEFKVLYQLEYEEDARIKRGVPLLTQGLQLEPTSE